MKLIEIAVETDGEAAEAISAVFNRHSRYGAVVEELWPAGAPPAVDGAPATAPVVRVKTFLAPEQACALTRLEEALWHLGQVYPLPSPSVRWLEEAEWAEAWKSGYKAFRLGRHMVIKPSWLAYAAAPDDLVIELDPGMAFGTGLHPSTRLIMDALEDQVRPGARVLDVGTGSGILAIAAARLGAAHVLAVDIDLLAVKAARENVARNGVQDRVLVQRASLIPGDGPADPDQPLSLLDVGGAYHEAFDLLLMNILSGVITRSAAPIAAALADGGVFIVAGIIQSQEELVRQALAAAGLSVLKRHTKKDWVSLIGGRNTSRPAGTRRRASRSALHPKDMT